MIPYTLHVALLITVCLLFYKLLLQKETFYRLNRVILVFCLALSFILPLVPIPQQWALRVADKPVEIKQQPVSTAQPVVDVPQSKAVTATAEIKQTSPKAPVALPAKAAPAETAHTTIQAITPSVPVIQTIVKWLFYLYWIGVAAFALNLLLQVVVLLFQAYTKPAIIDGKFRIVELTGDKAPCSFGNNIFINPEKYDWDTYSQILLHEKIHIQQRHSLDIIIAEAMLVLQWFNPFAWLYRTEVENNLEFLTDDSVLEHKEIERASYQMSLLKVSAPHLSLGITTNYNQSLLKRRIMMMNAKRSNIHIMWKYFFLVPLLGIMACALNSPMAYSATSDNTVAAKLSTKFSPVVKPNFNFSFKDDQTEGSWFANIKGEKIRIEFKGDDDDHHWSSSTDFMLSELSAVPRDKKADFTIKREAGTMLFTGKFEDNEGYGHYKFTADHQFNAFLGEHGITGVEDGDDFAFFMFNINKQYLAMVEHNGYKGVSKGDLISMGALKVDEAYIHFWKESGYTNLAVNQLVSGKALGITAEYVNEIRKAGYTHVTFDQLQSFKATGVTAKYIAGLHGANIKSTKHKDDNNTDPMPAEDVVSVKAMNVASTYIDAIQKSGYPNITLNDLTSMKAVGVTPQYIDELKLAGYTNIPAHELISLKSVGVTSAYAKSLAALGYKNINANQLTSMKSVGVTPEFIASLKASGYGTVSANDLVSLKSVGATPEFAKGFASLGYKNIPAHQLISMRAVGVTPEYVQSLKAAGYDNISANDLVSLKSQGVTPEFAKEYESVGYKSIPIHELVTLKALGITPEYIKSFQEAGYKDISIHEYSGLKAMGVTPQFIDGFKKIGFTDISLNEATSLKATGVTPEYVSEMRDKGFKSQNLNKYIQLKNAFGDNDNK